MKNSVIYIVGATVLVGGGAYLFLKNKKAKDELKLDELQKDGTGSTPNLSNKSDGVSPSDANLNLANATILVGKKKIIIDRMSRAQPPRGVPSFGDAMFSKQNIAFSDWANTLSEGRKELSQIDSELAMLGYKNDAAGQLIKI